MERAIDWYYEFIGVIPEQDLHDLWVLTRQKHENFTQPINALELVTRYSDLQEIKAKHNREKDALASANCSICQGKGYIDVDRMNVKICDHAKQSK